jgi:[protein-PII] uridylyltransferase
VAVCCRFKSAQAAMEKSEDQGSRLRGEYQRRTLAIRDAFKAGASGAATIAARSKAMDQLIAGLWVEATRETPALRHGVALVALGGYGRSELFPYSDVDLMYLLDGKVSERDTAVAADAEEGGGGEV